jgi:hypothetical protein
MSSFAMPILSPLLKNVSSARTFTLSSFNNRGFLQRPV